MNSSWGAQFYKSSSHIPFICASFYVFPDSIIGTDIKHSDAGWDSDSAYRVPPGPAPRLVLSIMCVLLPITDLHTHQKVFVDSLILTLCTEPAELRAAGQLRNHSTGSEKRRNLPKVTQQVKVRGGAAMVLNACSSFWI